MTSQKLPTRKAAKRSRTKTMEKHGRDNPDRDCRIFDSKSTRKCNPKNTTDRGYAELLELDEDECTWSCSRPNISGCRSV